MLSKISHDEWLEARRKGIGGSDVAAILGLSEWEGPYTVWADKMGLLPPRTDSEAMRQGRDLEHYVACRFCEKTGKKVRKVNRMLQSPEYYFMLANIDREVIGEDAGLECKTTSIMNLKKFRDGDYPPNYYCQCMHYMAVTGKKKWYLAVLVLNQGFFIFEIERDEDEISALIRKEREFWDYVESGEPPPIDGLDSTRDTLDAIYPTDSDMPTAVLFGNETLIEERARLKSEMKSLGVRVKEIDNFLIAELGGAERGLAHGYEITYRPISKAAYTVKSREYRQLKIKEVYQYE